MKEVTLESLFTMLFADVATRVAQMRGHEEVEDIDLEYVRNIYSRAKEKIQDMKEKTSL